MAFFRLRHAFNNLWDLQRLLWLAELAELAEDLADAEDEADFDSDDEAAGDQNELSSHLTGLAIGTTSTQLSNINTVSAPSDTVRMDVDEFDGTAIVEEEGPGGSLTSKEERAAAAECLPNITSQTGSTQSSFSKEFDRFLAERAAAADCLPNTTNQSGSTQSSSTARPKKNKEDESLMDF